MVRPCRRGGGGGGDGDLSRSERTEGQPFRSMAIGEEFEVSNAMEAVGQGVEQEAPDELVVF